MKGAPDMGVENIKTPELADLWERYASAPHGAPGSGALYKAYVDERNIQAWTYLNSEPTAPTEDWPGGWLVRSPNGRLAHPHGHHAWRTEDGARKAASPGDKVMWVGSTSNSGSWVFPLDSIYWADRDGLDPVGIVEIAERLKVKRATVDQWLQRELLPEASWRVGGRPAWPWQTIHDWADATGRLPE